METIYDLENQLEQSRKEKNEIRETYSNYSVDGSYPTKIRLQPD